MNLTKRMMLINATQPEELRVALTDRQQLVDLLLAPIGKRENKSNIYKGRITRIEPSLEAAFVDYGADRHGFLPFKEIAPQCFANPTAANIREAIREGQEIMVQVEKEERGNKGAALTTFVSLAGSYLVLMPNNPRAGGISRRIEGDDRADMRELLSSLSLPEDMGVIIRTAGVGKSQEELQWDLSVLLKHWDAIKSAFDKHPAPFLIHQESDVIIRAIRDYLRPDMSEIITDNKEVYEKVREHIQLVRPDYLQCVKLHTDNIPLFNRFHIESQIETAFQREVRLHAGGAIVIDHTEALTSIDVNSGRSTRGGDIEETAFHTNLEAAEEIARQLRLRDLGGLVVIDFIDMASVRHQRSVENRLRDALKMDRARVQVGRISRFGLLEMSRQRLRPSLPEFSQTRCPRCSGSGHIRGTQSLALSILRLIEEEAMKTHIALVRAHLPVSVATFLLNEKRQAIYAIEQRHKVTLMIIPHTHLHTPQYKVEGLSESATRDGRETQPSYHTPYPPEVEPISVHGHHHHRTEPAVKNIPVLEHPVPSKAEQPGFFRRMLRGLFGGDSEETPETAPHTATSSASTTNRQQSGFRPQRDRDSRRSREQQQGREGNTSSSSESNASGRYPRRSGQGGKNSDRRGGRLMGRGGRRQHNQPAETPATTSEIPTQTPIIVDATQPIIIPDVTSGMTVPQQTTETVEKTATTQQTRPPNSRRYGPRRYGHLRKRPQGGGQQHSPSYTAPTTTESSGSTPGNNTSPTETNKE